VSSVAVVYFYHLLVHVAIVQLKFLIVRLIAIKIFNQSAVLISSHNTGQDRTQLPSLQTTTLLLNCAPPNFLTYLLTHCM